MYTVNLGRGSKAFPASMQLPKWEIVTSAKCVRQPYLFSNMSQATLPSFCESECFSTTILSATLNFTILVSSQQAVEDIDQNGKS